MMPWRAIVFSAVLLFAAASSAAAEPKRVLLLDSFGHDFAPWNEFVRHFREDLFRQSRPIDLYGASLATARFAEVHKRRSLITFARFLPTISSSSHHHRRAGRSVHRTVSATALSLSAHVVHSRGTGACSAGRSYRE
jgi:hypothetical protein